MKVYIVYEKDGYEGEQVDKVFANEADAQDHVIANTFGLNMAYADMERHELEEEALKHITEHVVEGI
jgi:hypothetical protein